MNKVKILLIICTICFNGVLSTKAQNVFSLNPLFNEQDAILIPEIEGYWSMPDFDWTMSLKKTGDNFYHFINDINNPTYNYEAVFVKIKDELLLNLSGIMPEDIGDTDFRESFIPYYSIYKTNISNDSIYISSLNYSWFYNYAIKKKLPLKYEWISQGMLLTNSTEELQKFFTDQINKDEFFNNYSVIIVDNENFVTERDTILKSSLINTKVTSSKKCTPNFPLKNGWLGGDGDVSVQINDSTSIFFFSDSYVGNKNQYSRQEQGMRMVSNTISVQTCFPNGETDVSYYWNKMHTNNPKPFFQSYTNRYKFWIADAFIAENNLYVLLSKVGPKLGAAPNDIFNFSGLGYTLAKISNPHMIPDKWKIELLPFTDFKSFSMELNCHVILDNYIYFFLNQNDTSQYLVRKHKNNIEKIEVPFEYFSLNKDWKQGIKPNDMFEISKGFRSNSVNFHSEINQWVMISDIRFIDNKIKMRVAKKLFGPWSDEIVIYEIPEMTQGNSLYSKSNYCYLAREHIQYYNSNNHMMLLTYDINNTNYSEIVSNPKIYTPKVIKIQLKKNSSY